MELSIVNNNLLGARHVDSPNQSGRSGCNEIDLLIIHNISLPPGEYGTACIDQLFCNCLDENAHPYFRDISRLRVSSHFLIDRNGEITQYVPLDRKAWHAGESAFSGRENCNDFSIGIELEGTDLEPFTDLQYSSLVSLSALLVNEYPGLDSSRIVGHSNVAPGRKTDPGPFFKWDSYRSSLKDELASIA